METKSRYEVIAELESKKRDLIQERDGLNNEMILKEKELKNTVRTKSDQILAWDRKIEDLQEDLENFKKSMDQRKETIQELINSVDDSLARFNTLNKK